MKTLLTLFALFTFMLAPVTPVAHAQAWESDASDLEDGVLWQLASMQVILSLESEYGHVRGQTLKNAIVFSTLYRDKVDLSSAVGAIAAIAKSDESREHRRLAMAALQAIGSYRAKQHLAELKGIEDDEYRVLVATVISEFYAKPDAL